MQSNSITTKIIQQLYAKNFNLRANNLKFALISQVEYFAIKSTQDDVNDLVKDSAITLYNGFVPSTEVARFLPLPFKLWDTLANELPARLANFSLKRTLEEMPLLDETNLEDKYLGRAAIVVSSLAHGYSYLAPKAPLPDTLETAWRQISKRIGRAAIGRTAFEDFLGNWSYKNPLRTNNKIYNYDMAVDFFVEPENKIMCLTVMQIEKEFGKVFRSVVQAQTAVLNQDNVHLIHCLQQVNEMMKKITVLFTQISTNPKSKNYVDPIIWAKTFGGVGVSTRASELANTGAELPMFHILDQFLGRQHFDTELGKQMLYRRKNLPMRIQAFLNLFNEASVYDYVKQTNNEALNLIYSDVCENYLGEEGFLGVHRRKAFNFVKLGVLAGRKTNTDYDPNVVATTVRPWESIHQELKVSSMERQAPERYPNHKAEIVESKSVATGLTDVAIADPHLVHYQAGDKLCVTPTNKLTNIHAISKLLGVCPVTTNVILSEHWRDLSIQMLGVFNPTITLLQFLQFADVQPMAFSLIEKIHQQFNLPHNELIGLENCSFLVWLDYLQQKNVNLKDLFLNTSKQDSYISHILQPMDARLYSITSDAEHDKEIHLLVGKVQAPESKICPFGFTGTASSYLNKESKEALCHIRPGYHFNFAMKKGAHSILIAAGSGISAFMSFLRGVEAHKYHISLFYSARTLADVAFYDELQDLAKSKGIQLFILITSNKYYIKNGVRIDVDDSHINSVLLKEKYVVENADFINSKNAFIKIVGSGEFFSTTLDTLQTIFARQYNMADTKDIVHWLAANYQLAYETYSASARNSLTLPVYTNFEVAKHNHHQDLWIVIENIIYDLTKFVGLHPGGDKIIYSCGGLDATSDFNRLHNNRWIRNNLASYRVGLLDQGSDYLNKALYEKLSNALADVVASENNFGNNTYFHGRNISLVILMPILSTVLLEPLSVAYRSCFQLADLFSVNHDFAHLSELITTSSDTIKNAIAKIRVRLEKGLDTEIYFNKNWLLSKIINSQADFIEAFKNNLIHYFSTIMMDPNAATPEKFIANIVDLVTNQAEQLVQLSKTCTVKFGKIGMFDSREHSHKLDSNDLGISYGRKFS